MTTGLIVVQHESTHALKALVLDSLTSPESKRSYRKALDDFLEWYDRDPRPGFTKATVQAYRSELEAGGLSPSTINVRMAAWQSTDANAASARCGPLRPRPERDFPRLLREGRSC